MTGSPVAEIPAFTVHLTNFDGPFDLLLQLITRHRLDITEVALSRVTDEFVAHIKHAQQAQGPGRWDLDQTSHFVLVAATLLDLKAARLLPQGEVDDPEDLAVLEARDLLFARLLQYRAFKVVGSWIGDILDRERRRHPRPGGLEDRFARLLPEVDLSGLADRLARLAAGALAPKDPVQVSLAHLHAPAVSVREQAEILVQRLRSHHSLTFLALTGDAGDRLVVVARFLALLDLYRESAVAFEQVAPLAELTVRWLGADVDAATIGAEFDDSSQEAPR